MGCASSKATDAVVAPAVLKPESEIIAAKTQKEDIEQRQAVAALTDEPAAEPATNADPQDAPTEGLIATQGSNEVTSLAIGNPLNDGTALSEPRMVKVNLDGIMTPGVEIEDDQTRDIEVNGAIDEGEGGAKDKDEDGIEIHGPIADPQDAPTEGPIATQGSDEATSLAIGNPLNDGTARSEPRMVKVNLDGIMTPGVEIEDDHTRDIGVDGAIDEGEGGAKDKDEDGIEIHGPIADPQDAPTEGLIATQGSDEVTSLAVGNPLNDGTARSEPRMVKVNLDGIMNPGVELEDDQTRDIGVDGAIGEGEGGAKDKDEDGIEIHGPIDLGADGVLREIDADGNEEKNRGIGIGGGCCGVHGGVGIGCHGFQCGLW